MSLNSGRKNDLIEIHETRLNQVKKSLEIITKLWEEAHGEMRNVFYDAKLCMEMDIFEKQDYLENLKGRSL